MNCSMLLGTVAEIQTVTQSAISSVQISSRRNEEIN